MSRSNGSQPPSAAQAQQGGGYEFNPDARAWAAPQGQATQQRPLTPASPTAQAPDYGYAQQPAGYAHQPAGYGQAQGHADPYAQHGGYYQTTAQAPVYSAPAQHHVARPAGQPNNGQLTGASGYAPQFDPYVPAQNPTHHPVQPSAAAYPDLRGSTYDQWAVPAQQPDPRGYDLSGYTAHDPQASYGAAYQGLAGNTAHSQSYNPASSPVAQPAARQNWEWAQPQPQYAPQGFDTYQPSPASQLQPAAQDYGHQAGTFDQGQPAQGQFGQGQFAEGQSDAYPEDMADGLDEAVPRGRRGFMIAATLAGAILVGGGLTYAYNSLLGPGASGAPPLVKSTSGPAKVKPAEPGGKQFAHADSKVLGRLNEADTAGGLDASGAKKVATLVVKPDGTIEPPAMAAEPAPAAAPPPASAVPPVPGLSVISVGATPAAIAAPAAPAAPAALAPVAAAQKPVVVSPPPAAAPAPKAPVVISSASASTLVETAAVPAAEAATVVKKPAPVKKVAALAPAAASAPAAAPSGAGYMAVIASVPASAKSRMDALTRWADMQQKYGSILQNKTMDVQEAKVADKGTYHRLLVGPPSSKDTASSICSDLKAAGHTDCWVMAY